MRARVATYFMLTVGMAVTGLAPTSAAAAVNEPVLLPTTSVAGSGTPILSWQRVPDATSYEVQVSSDSFTSTRWSSTTVNVNAVPTSALPSGNLQWRVRASDGRTVSAWSVGSFERPVYTAPTNLTPNGGTIRPPDSFPVYNWNPVPGAESYVLQVSTDSSFSDVSRLKTYTTQATTYSPTTLPEPNVYHWRVMATLASGISTPWSAQTPSYEVLGLRIPDSAKTPVSPADSGDPGMFTSVTDAVLDWNEIPGAATYDLQISTDRNFSTVDHSASKITGTRYARPATLDNDQYFWRIRPVDARGNTLEWSDPELRVWKFRRHWPAQPQLEHPAVDATVGDPLYYQWRPVPHASKYLLEISTSPTMSTVLSKHKCFTTNTTFVPGTVDKDRLGDPACWPEDGGTYYWRVTAYDEHTGSSGPRTDNTLGVTEVRRFTYQRDTVTQLTPAPDQTVSVPTLTWQPVPMAEQYKVTITPLASGSATTLTTTGTSVTPRTKLADGNYRWMVQPVTRDGRVGAALLANDQRRFTVEAPAAGTAATPEPITAEDTFARLPTLEWTPVAQATKYEVLVRPSGSGLWQPLTKTVYPAFQAFGTTSDQTANLLQPQTYEWRVVSYDSTGVATEGNGSGQFTISEPGQVQGHRVALAGGSFGTDECEAAAADECDDLRQTPILRWDAAPTAAKYLLVVSRDAEWTNKIKTFYVDGTMAMPRFQWPDSQAGSAYYWEVFECAPGDCVITHHARHSFNKESHPVKVLAPGKVYGSGVPEASLPRVSDDITLEWEDYLASNTAASPNGSALSTPSRDGARLYEIQVATDPSFVSRIDTAQVDQTSYTSAATTYPEGIIYWRVRALDGDSNPLSWSPTHAFVKKSPVPTLKTVTSDLLEWNPLNFAASYDLEVYKGADRTANPANRVASTTTDQPRYAPSSPWRADTTYVWRVRRVDVKGRKGDWSSWGQFTGRPGVPTLTAPAAGAEVAPRGAVFTWRGIDGAMAYRFDTWVDGSTSKVESATTRALAYAPSKVLPAGTMKWSVTALNGANQEIGTAQRGYSVQGVPTATTATGITGSPQVGQQLRVVAPQWNMTGVTTTYAWLRDDRPITGATGATYQVTTDDFERKLSVRATGTRPGYDVGTSTSSPVTIGSGAPVAPSTAPRITGKATVGNRLSVSTGTWPPDARFTYQWLRSGRAIAGATSSSYTLLAEDAGRRISATVTASVRGYSDATASSNQVSVPRMASRVNLKVSPTKVRRKARATLSGTVTVSGVSSPRGRVTIKLRGKVIKKINLSARAGGRFTYRLPKRAPGAYKIVVQYAGNTTTKASSRSAVLRVIR